MERKTDPGRGPPIAEEDAMPDEWMCLTDSPAKSYLNDAGGFGYIDVYGGATAAHNRIDQINASIKPERHKP
jgi:hypothetical protein